MFSPVPVPLAVDGGGSLFDAVAYGIARNVDVAGAVVVAVAVVVILGAVAFGVAFVYGNAHADGFADGLAYADRVRGDVGGVGAIFDPADVGPGVWRRPTEHDDRNRGRGGVV